MSNSKIYLGSTNLGTGKIRLGGDDVSAIYLGSSLVYGGTTPPTPTGDYLCFTAEEANSTIGMTHNGTNQTTTQPVMYYSTDQTNWTLWDYSNITLANIGDKVYFYGDNPNGFSSSTSNYSIFTTSGSVACSGNIMTLITRDGSETTIPNNSCFLNLFRNTAITTAPVLPATTLDAYCYNGMFRGCTSLVNAPSLPATTLASYCYKEMFYGCSNLITAPELPATTLTNKCYYSMFGNCTRLTIAPALPATTLATDCYSGMFQGCTRLTIAPSLPATTLVKGCYNNMFNGCSSLNSIAINIESWNTSMASNWVNNVSGTGTFLKPYALQTGTGTGEIPLNATNGIPTGWTVQNTNDYLCFTVETAPFTFNLGGDGNAVVYYSTDKTNWNLLNNYSNVTLQNVGDKVYFYGNNPNGFSYSQSNFDVFHTSAGSYSVSGNIMSLIDISCPSTIPNSYCFVSLFSDTSIVSAEHLLLPAQTLTDYCYFDMFARSTLSTPPELPATTLAESCYGFMFDDTDITQSPILAVGILPQGCYYRMFRNCSNLNTVTCLATDITAQYCTQNWLENVAATGTFTKDSSMTSWTTGASGIPSGWTVVDAQ